MVSLRRPNTPTVAPPRFSLDIVGSINSAPTHLTLDLVHVCRSFALTFTNFQGTVAVCEATVFSMRVLWRSAAVVVTPLDGFFITGMFKLVITMLNPVEEVYDAIAGAVAQSRNFAFNKSHVGMLFVEFFWRGFERSSNPLKLFRNHRSNPEGYQ